MRPLTKRGHTSPTSPPQKEWPGVRTWGDHSRTTTSQRPTARQGQRPLRAPHCCPTTPHRSPSPKNSKESHSLPCSPNPFTEVAARCRGRSDPARRHNWSAGRQAQSPTLCQPQGEAVLGRRKQHLEGAEGREAAGRLGQDLRAGPSPWPIRTGQAGQR